MQPNRDVAEGCWAKAIAGALALVMSYEGVVRRPFSIEIRNGRRVYRQEGRGATSLDRTVTDEVVGGGRGPPPEGLIDWCLAHFLTSADEALVRAVAAGQRATRALQQMMIVSHHIGESRTKSHLAKLRARGILVNGKNGYELADPMVGQFLAALDRVRSAGSKSNPGD
jgi:hypothetical protein